MFTPIKALFVHTLRNAAAANQPRIEGAELIITPTATAFDAYGILAMLHMELEDMLVGFVPTVTPFEYFYWPRQALIAWSGITDAELNALIEMNDEEGLGFAEIADVIEAEWA